MNKNTKHDVYNRTMIQPIRKTQGKTEITLHQNPFQTLFSRTPSWMVMNISIGLVDLLTFDTTWSGCGGLIRKLIN